MRLKLNLLTLTLLLGPTLVAAQGTTDDLDEFINYPYAVADTAFLDVVGQSVQVVRLPFSYTLRSRDEHPWGAKLRFPVSMGFHEFTIDDAFGGELSETVGTLSALAGAEFQIPLNDRWTLEPFAELGAGKDLDGGAVAYIYSAGIDSVVTVRREAPWVRLGAGADYDGAKLEDGGPSEGFSTLTTGIDVSFAIGKAVGGRRADWSLYAMRRRFLPELVFDQLDGERIEVRNQNELGITLGFDRPFRWWLLRIDRIGLGYRFGDKLSSVRVLFGAPF